MFGPLVPAAPLALGLVVALVVAVVLRPVRTDRPVSPSVAWSAAVRHASLVSLTAWSVLVVVALAGASGTPSMLVSLAGGRALLTGVALALSPSVAGLAFVLVHAVGELTWPRPVGTIRRAVLARRPLRDVVPAGPLAALAGWVLALVVLLAVCAAVAPDGRSVRVQVRSDVSSQSGPFPGAFYGVPIGVALVVLLAATAGVLRLVARRPPVSDTDPADDTALRRTSAARVLGGTQLVCALTLAGCLLTASMALRNAATAGIDDATVGRDGLLALATAGMVAVPVVLVAAVVLAALSGRRRSAAPALAGSTALSPA